MRIGGIVSGSGLSRRTVHEGLVGRLCADASRVEQQIALQPGHLCAPAVSVVCRQGPLRYTYGKVGVLVPEGLFEIVFRHDEGGAGGWWLRGTG